MAKKSNQKNKKKNYHEGNYTPRKVEAARAACACIFRSSDNYSKNRIF